MMAFARGPLLKVESFRPGRAFGGTVREFMKGLQEELGTSPTAMDDPPSAAPLGDGRDAGERLQFAGRLEPLAIGAEGSEQAWGEGRSGARPVVEQGRVRVLGQQLAQACFVPVDRLVESPQLPD